MGKSKPWPFASKVGCPKAASTDSSSPAWVER